MNKDIDVLVSEGKGQYVSVCGKKYFIGKINTITYLRLLKVLAVILQKYSKQLKELSLTDSNTGDMFAIISMLDETDLLELISVLLNENDKEQCKDIEPEELVDLIDAVCEYNDFEALLKKVKGVVGKFQK